MVTTIDEIKDDIKKIKNAISIKEFQKKVLKRRAWLRGEIDVDPDANYWQNLKDQLTDPLAKDLVDQVKNLGNEVVEYDERINQILSTLGYKEEVPDFEGVADATNPHVKIYWTKLADKLASSDRDDGTLRDLEDLVNIVINVKKHLGLSDKELDNLTSISYLTMPSKKVGGIDNNLTLKELIDNYNTISNHLSNSRSLDKLIDEANSYQALNIAANDIIREKGEINQTKINTLKTAQQQVPFTLFKEINQLGLGLENNKITKDNVFQKIKELINKPVCAHPDYNTLKTENEQLKEKNAKALANITNASWNNLGINISEKQKYEIQNSSTPNEVWNHAERIIRNEMVKLKDENNNSFYLNIGLGVLVIVSLFLVGWMILKWSSLSKIGTKRRPKRFNY